MNRREIVAGAAAMAVTAVLPRLAFSEAEIAATVATLERWRFWPCADLGSRHSLWVAIAMEDHDAEGLKEEAAWLTFRRYCDHSEGRRMLYDWLAATGRSYRFKVGSHL